MRVSELTPQILAVFSRRCLDADDWKTLDDAQKTEVQAALMAAKGYASGYTGVDLEQSNLEDVTIAILIIGSEMLDNRQLTAQYTAQNPLVVQILSMHATNLLPEVE
jgi:hypothetical protein